MLPLLKFTVMRLALFVAAMGLLYVVGIRALLPNLVLAGVISLLLSYVLLYRPREELARRISDRVSGRLKDGPGRRSGVDEDAAHEDAIVDGAGSVDEPGTRGTSDGAGRPARD